MTNMESAPGQECPYKLAESEKELGQGGQHTTLGLLIPMRTPSHGTLSRNLHHWAVYPHTNPISTALYPWFRIIRATAYPDHATPPLHYVTPSPLVPSYYQCEPGWLHRHVCAFHVLPEFTRKDAIAGALRVREGWRIGLACCRPCTGLSNHRYQDNNTSAFMRRSSRASGRVPTV